MNKTIRYIVVVLCGIAAVVVLTCVLYNNRVLKIKKDIFKYKGISYGQLKQMYPNISAKNYWYKKFAIDIPGEDIIVYIFDEDYPTNHDVPIIGNLSECEYIVSTLGNIFDGRLEKMRISDFLDSIAVNGACYPEYSVVNTVGNAHHFSRKYLYIKMDCDCNGIYDTALFIDVDGQENNYNVGADSKVALYLNYLP